MEVDVSYNVTVEIVVLEPGMIVFPHLVKCLSTLMLANLEEPIPEPLGHPEVTPGTIVFLLTPEREICGANKTDGTSILVYEKLLEVGVTGLCKIPHVTARDIYEWQHR